jgi:aldehyde dehydrogenase (NAD+)
VSLTVLPVRDELGVRPGRLFIDGRWLDGASGETLEQIHPASGEVTTTIARGGARDIDAAVRAARRAFDEGPWPTLPANERRKLLLEIARLVDAHAEELNRLQTLDNGMPITFSSLPQVSAAFLVDAFEYYAGWVDKIGGRTIPVYPGAGFDFTLREPVGVVGTIIPWNAPLVLLALKLPPALAMGNTVVLKPSELASLCALRVGELLEEAELPPGVVNIVTGTGSEAGGPLAAHPGVDKVSFTGGVETGRAVMRACAEDLRRVSLELGGKSANILFGDAPDLDQAVLTAVGTVAMGLSGQGCACVTRALVEETIYDDVIQRIERVLPLVRVGNPFEATTTAGPIISTRQLERVLSYIDIGKREGARLLCGGARLDGELARGNFVAATVFTDVRNEMRIAQEEIFGPVLSVLRFRDLDDAVRIANASRYGLAGQVWTRDIRKALAVARRVRTGTMGINGYAVVPTAPFGGYKQSGFGREGGRESLDLFTEVKNVFVNLVSPISAAS